MTDYVVMFPADNEADWQAGTEADHQATYDTDAEFAALLRARGGAVTSGAGLTHSSQARTLRRGAQQTVQVTDGPFAESVEQISGFYLVTCEDYDALTEAAQVLTRAHPVVEIRPVESS
ncbi:YciI family protein [Ornithinimicrobium cryptoxanthini]|uniref:YciI family protein n=1 Tax=Ornithinimicrobium cryptoxanthini TaxID=2934161 RepID=UPI0021195C52|nr:YciI family protein [Ornithinimicrobium cryptoxanthini]